MSKKKIVFNNLVDSLEVNKITLGADPDNDMEAATKQYVDNNTISITDTNNNALKNVQFILEKDTLTIRTTASEQ